MEKLIRLTIFFKIHKHGKEVFFPLICRKVTKQKFFNREDHKWNYCFNCIQPSFSYVHYDGMFT